MPVFNWSAHPALRAAIALVIGISLCDVVTISAALVVVCIAVLLVLCRVRYVSSAAAIVLVAAAGCILAHNERAVTLEPPDALDVARVDCVGRVVETHQRGDVNELVLVGDSLMLRNTAVRTHRARVLVRVNGTRDVVASPGERISVVGTVRAPRAPAVRGSFDERAFLRARGVSLVLDVQRLSAVHRITGDRRWPHARLVDAARARMARFAAAHVGGDEAAVVTALLSGDRSGVDRQTRDAFAATGTLHVLAVSGLHVAVIALALSVLTSWIANRRLQLLLFISVLGAYALIAGAGPSIVRAWCMASFFMIARVAGRRAEPLNVLGASALVLLIASPSELYDIGFQLSFAAVGGILLFYRRTLDAIDERWRSVRNVTAVHWLARAIVLTAAAQTLTAPLLLAHFGSVPALGLLLNLPVVPLTSTAMAAAAIGVLVDGLPMLPECMGATALVCTRIALVLVNAGASLPFASFGGVWLTSSGALCIICLAALSARSRTHRSMFVRLGLTFTLLVMTIAVERRLESGRPGDGASAWIVPLGASSALVASWSDSLLVVARDSLALERARSLLQRVVERFDPKRVMLAALADESSTALRRAASDVAFVRARPIALVSGGRHPVRAARAGGVPVLVISLDHKLERALELSLDGTVDNRWRQVSWR